jgi:hypothetical protein
MSDKIVDEVLKLSEKDMLGVLVLFKLLDLESKIGTDKTLEAIENIKKIVKENGKK